MRPVLLNTGNCYWQVFVTICKQTRSYRVRSVSEFWKVNINIGLKENQNFIAVCSSGCWWLRFHKGFLSLGNLLCLCTGDFEIVTKLVPGSGRTEKTETRDEQRLVCDRGCSPETSWRGLGCPNPSLEVRAHESSSIQYSETRSRSHTFRPSGSSKDGDRKKKYLDSW